MSEPTPKYIKEGHEVRYAGGLLVAGDLVPDDLVEHVPPEALDDAPTAPDEEPSGDAGSPGATGGTGDAPSEPFELEGE